MHKLLTPLQHGKLGYKAHCVAYRNQHQHQACMQHGYTAHVIQREVANVAKLPLLNVPAIELLDDEALQHTNIAAASSTHKGSPSEHEPCRGTTCIDDLQ